MSSVANVPNSTLEDFPTAKAHLAAILKTGDVVEAVHQALGVFFAIHEHVRLLQDDAVRGDDTLVVEIANMIAEQSSQMMGFLDRPGGWSK